jgi:integrase
MRSLTRDQLDALLAEAKRHSERDYLMLLVTFQHALRVSETLSLAAGNITNGFIRVKRGKGSRPAEHPLLANEKEALQRLAETTPGQLFPISRATFWRRIQDYGQKAGVPSHLCHPHALKHTCGRLGFLGGMTVPDLVEYLGHVNPSNSLIYAKSDIATASAAFAAAVGQ